MWSSIFFEQGAKTLMRQIVVYLETVVIRNYVIT